MRRTILTPELQKQIVDNLTLGVTVQDTCALVGISLAAYYGWVRRGEKPGQTNPVYVQFAQAVTRARVEARRAAIVTVRRAVADGDVDAAQWLLERSDPEHWGRRVFVEGNVSVALVNRAIRALASVGVDASEVFENLILESLHAEQPINSASGD